MAESLSPIFLATAVQAVIKAGAMQLAGIDHLHVEKKGAIDLVTQIDRDVEQMFRALIARRFPDHAVLAEEFETGGDRQNEAEYCWVFDPVDGTTNYAHGLPIFCCACSLERNGQPIVAAIYDPSRRELFTAERGARRVAERRADARVVGRHADRFAALHGISLHRAAGSRLPAGAVRRLHSTARAQCAVSGPRRSIWRTSRRAGSTGSGR